MPDYTLLYFPSNASVAPHMVLEEIGASYALELVDRRQNAHKGEAYLKLNPNGRIPTMIDHRLGDLVIFESAAICLHLADRHPEAGLMPASGTAERARAYQWLMWLTNTLQTDTLGYHYGAAFLRAPDEAAGAAIRRGFEARLDGWYRIAADALNASGGPYFLGKRFSLVDLYFAMIARWARHLTTPPRRHAGIDRLLTLIAERPAVQRAYDGEGVPRPYFDAV